MRRITPPSDTGEPHESHGLEGVPPAAPRPPHAGADDHGPPAAAHRLRLRRPLRHQTDPHRGGRGAGRDGRRPPARALRRAYRGRGRRPGHRRGSAPALPGDHRGRCRASPHHPGGRDRAVRRPVGPGGQPRRRGLRCAAHPLRTRGPVQPRALHGGGHGALPHRHGAHCHRHGDHQSGGGAGAPGGDPGATRRHAAPAPRRDHRQDRPLLPRGGAGHGGHHRRRPPAVRRALPRFLARVRRRRLRRSCWQCSEWGCSSPPCLTPRGRPSSWPS